jgi:hypothetical protein
MIAFSMLKFYTFATLALFILWLLILGLKKLEKKLILRDILGVDGPDVLV